MPVSIRDIARHTGLGRTTVSLALRNAPGVATKTRLQVLEVAETLGYRSDPTVARIAARRWQRPEDQPVLAFLTDETLDAELAQEVALAGYRLENFPLNQYQDYRRLSRTLYNRGIEGVFLGRGIQPDFVEQFDFSRFACISTRVGYARIPVHQVQPNVTRAAEQAWHEVLSHGYRRPGIILFNEFSARDFIDREGAFLAMQRRELDAEDILPFLLLTPKKIDGARIQKWLEQHRPDAVICLTNAFYWCITELGYRIPEDLGYVTLSSPVNAVDSYAYMATPEREIARTSTWLMDRLLRENQRGIPDQRLKILIDQQWRPGPTLPRKTTG